MKTCRYFFAAVSAVTIFSACNNQTSTTQTELASPVSVIEVGTASIRKYNNTTGTALSNAEVELKSEMAGTYHLQINPRTRQPYKLGDAINKGDLIVRLEDKEYENGIAIESKKLSLELAEQEQVKQKALYDKGGVTLTELRNTEVNITNAKYSYENAQIQLEKMNVRAPFSGVIVSIPHYTSGGRIESGQSLVSIMNYTKMLMEINLPESAITEVKTGQEVLITHYTLPDDTIIGTVSELSPAVSSETRTFKGKIQINNEKMLLRPGMFVKADIIVDEEDDTIVIPKNIILNNRNRKYVYVVEKGLAKQRNLQTGLEDDNNIEVLEGLEVGEELVIRGYETLREDSKVKIQK